MTKSCMRDAFYLWKVFDASAIFLEKYIQFYLFLSHSYNDGGEEL